MQKFGRDDRLSQGLSLPGGVRVPVFLEERRVRAGVGHLQIPQAAFVVVPGHQGRGLAVNAFEEPEPTEKFKAEDYRGPWKEEIPIHCMSEARKVDGLDNTSA